MRHPKSDATTQDGAFDLSGLRKHPAGTVDGRRVFLVDGRFIRDHVFMDFCEGGNGARYKFIPRGELWVEEALRDEFEAIVTHEAVEARAMERGLTYDDAHEEANRAEATVRRERLTSESAVERTTLPRRRA